MKLIVTEKPSVAMTYAKVLGVQKRHEGYLEGNGYLVSWCVGHLVELAPPEDYDPKLGRWSASDLPILPDDWMYRVSEKTKKQFEILRSLMQRGDVDGLICATDAGREGELIFRLVYHQCECTKPFERLWLSSMEDSAIREGFAHLRHSSDYDALYEAALCRVQADWMVGINATRLFSCLYGQTLHVGRVMSPTLAMAVEREANIAAFQPEPFYTVELSMDGFTAASQRIQDKSQAEQLQAFCGHGTAVVQKVERREKTEQPPLLYDLTTLQRDANRLYGFTAQQTLDYAQSLYEKKLITYPRTDSKYLTEDMEESVENLALNAAGRFQLPIDQPNVQRLCNSGKVNDHHALLPTDSMTRTDSAELPSGEQTILQMICCRLLCAVGTPFRYEETLVQLTCGDAEFAVKGRTILESGWKEIVQHFGLPQKQAEDKHLPVLAEGDSLPVLRADCKEGKTTPPKHYTEDLLLQAMETASAEEMPEEAERKGIGTSATRAATIEKLVQTGLLERKGAKSKALIPTAKGAALITVLPEQLQSASLTADWEEKLLRIEHGEYQAEAFREEIREMTIDLVKHYKPVENADILMPVQGKVIGHCPACGSEVTEKRKGWFCSNSGCKLALWKDNRYLERHGKRMTEQLARRLLADGKARLKDCKSVKTGKTYNATLHMILSEQGRVQYSLTFDGGRYESK